MNTLPISKNFSAEQQRYADAIESAIEIIFLYEDDEDECLSDDSVVDDLVENHGYSISDAQAMLATAIEIHQQRTLNGFCNS